METYGEADLNKLPTTENAPLTENERLLKYVIDKSWEVTDPDELSKVLLGSDFKITDFEFIPGNTPPITKDMVFKCRTGWFKIKVNGKSY